MKPTVQNFRSDQPKMLSKREDKKSVNLKWNSRLFFQLGLILSLVATILVVESTIGLTYATTVADINDPFIDPPTITYVVDTPKPVVVEEKKVEIQKPVVRKPITEVLTVIDNDVSDKTETKLASTETAPPSIPSPTPGPTKPVVNTGPRDIISVEFVPVFPGCEMLTTNDERRQCLSEKISAFIARKFDSDKFSYLEAGKTFRIDVQFKIDALGNVTDVRSRAPERQLEEEAIRVINKLPSIKPGMQGTTPVEVFYRIPITFQSRN